MSKRRAAPELQDEIMSKETLALIAALIINGQAAVIRKGGKLMVVSHL